MTSQKPSSRERNLASLIWYEDNAHKFTEADAIEVPFVGLDREAQHRLNRFKLHAIDSRQHVDLDGKSVLEFGAGHGRLAVSYPRMERYVGVDFSPNLVEIGNRRLAGFGLQHWASLVHGDVMTFEAPLHSFDVVCSLGMITYFPDPEPVLQRMVQFLKPGGVLLFDFRADSAVFSLVRRVKWALSKPTGGASYMIHPARVRQLLSGLGCTDIKLISREFPLLAGLYAKRHWNWPLHLRNRIAGSDLARTFATEAWAVAKLPPIPDSSAG
jgi:SAM-dependent methyltransferase